MKRMQSGFTLLEMIVVLVIIGLIMGLVGPKLFAQADKAKVQTAEAQVKMLRAGLEMMRLDIGRFPTAEEGLGLLMEKPSEPRAAQKWEGPYLDDGLPVDPWGNAYRYAPVPTEKQPFALYSQGANGEPGGEGYDADIGYTPKR